MRTGIGLGIALCLVAAACFVGEPLDERPEGTTTMSSRTDASDGGAPDPAPGEAGTQAPPTTMMPPTPTPPPTTPTTMPPGPPPVAAGPPPTSCAAGQALVKTTASGGAGTIASNPPGITVSPPSGTAACFAIGQTVVLEEAAHQICDWTGVSCKDGNTADRRCEFIVGAGGAVVTVAIP